MEAFDRAPDPGKGIARAARSARRPVLIAEDDTAITLCGVSREEAHRALLAACSLPAWMHGIARRQAQRN